MFEPLPVELQLVTVAVESMSIGWTTMNTDSLTTNLISDFEMTFRLSKVGLLTDTPADIQSILCATRAKLQDKLEPQVINRKLLTKSITLDHCKMSQWPTITIY